MRVPALVLLLAMPMMVVAQTDPAPSPRALLLAPDLQCRTQLKAAAGELAGKPLTLADDAFTKTDSLVLATVGQAAGGRMQPPTMILRLRYGAEGCQLMMDGNKKTIALKDCTCGGLSTKPEY
ncbi:MAG TPA: hypothetical protein VF928_11790 [Usitatibacteraceae bacterium]